MKLYLYSACEKQNASTDSPVLFSQLSFQIEKRQTIVDPGPV